MRLVVLFLFTYRRPYTFLPASVSVRVCMCQTYANVGFLQNHTRAIFPVRCHCLASKSSSDRAASVVCVTAASCERETLQPRFRHFQPLLYCGSECVCVYLLMFCVENIVCVSLFLDIRHYTIIIHDLQSNQLS